MPSARHLDMQHRAVTWTVAKATGRGIRAGLEIALEAGYVADAVVLMSWQYRFAEEYGLITRMRRQTPREQSILPMEINPEVACVFECKVSRSDFMATFGQESNRARAAGNLHWVVGPAKAISESHLPEFWGVLTPKGRGLSELRPPTLCPTTHAVIHQIAYQLLWYGIDSRGAKAGWNDRRKVTRALTAAEIARIPKEHLPENGIIERHEHVEAHPRLAGVSNRVGYLFEGAEAEVVE